MKNSQWRLPAIIIAIGLILSVVACLITNVVLTPTITEQNFDYKVTYKLNGETKTLEGVYNCRFDGYKEGQNPNERYYTGELVVDGQSMPSHTYTIAQKDGAKLYIVTLFSDSYLMGDANGMDYAASLNTPYLEAVDNEGVQYDEAEMPSEFAAEIVSWEYPEPINNTFVFSGFSLLHTGSRVTMLVVGLLMILACIVFVRRDKTVPYKALDKVSILLNVVITVVFIPFVTIMVYLFQLTVSSDSFLYQFFLCTPAVTAFAVAASVALRRVSFTKSGFFIQFTGPVLFFVPIVLEAVINNIFG